MGFIGVDSLEPCVGCVAGVGLSRGGFAERLFPTTVVLLLLVLLFLLLRAACPTLCLSFPAVVLAFFLILIAGL